MTARVDAQAAKERAEAWLADTEAGGVTDHSTPASLARDVLALVALLADAEKAAKRKDEALSWALDCLELALRRIDTFDGPPSDYDARLRAAGFAKARAAFDAAGGAGAE